MPKGVSDTITKSEYSSLNEKIWTYDPINNVMNIDNTVVRVPYKN